MAITIRTKYVNVLKEINDWVEISEWAIAVGEKYPEVLESANKDAENQNQNQKNRNKKRRTTGLKEIAARIGSAISTGGITELEQDTSIKPRKVKYMSLNAIKENQDQILVDDIEPLNRRAIERSAVENFTKEELYRTKEFWAISKDFKDFLNLDFEVDHATALLNNSEPGTHHPDNLQLLIKIHNAKKSNNNYTRFDIEKQIEYIKRTYSLQFLIEEQQGEELHDNILEGLIDRLRKVF